MSALASILIGAAAKVGAPIVKSILEKTLGGTAGGIAGSVVDAIAGEAGVTPEKLPELAPAEIEKAIAAVEPRTPELINAYVAQQAETNRLLLAEMDKGPFWSWAWRPGGMYLLGLFWAWLVLGVPVVNLFLGLFGASERLGLTVDVTTMLTLSGGYIGLYMGGHTVKDAMAKWTAKPA
jgi:hypothetical protein